MSKEQIADFLKANFSKIKLVCNALYQKDLIAGTDGNVSIKLPDNKGFLITASGIHKGFLKIEDMVGVDWQGNVIFGNVTPSSESQLHSAIYQADKGINSIIHTHAPWTTALNLSGKAFDMEKLVETKTVLKKVEVVPYSPPGTKELAQNSVKKLGSGPALILEKHGAVTYGKDIEQAFVFMECLEHNAKIIALSYMING